MTTNPYHRRVFPRVALVCIILLSVLALETGAYYGAITLVDHYVAQGR